MPANLRTFHDQDCDNYCGPACLMMMLESQGVDPASTFQAYMMSSIILAREVSGIAWESSPEAMVQVANDMLGAPASDPVYEIYPPQPRSAPAPTQADYAQKIKTAISNYKAPVFLLVNSGGHWIIAHKASATRVSALSPSSLGYNRGDTVPHDTKTCSECGAGRSTCYKLGGLFRTFNPVISSDPTYNGQMIMLVPRRQVS